MIDWCIPWLVTEFSFTSWESTLKNRQIVHTTRLENIIEILSKTNIKWLFTHKHLMCWDSHVRGLSSRSTQWTLQIAGIFGARSWQAWLVLLPNSSPELCHLSCSYHQVFNLQSFPVLVQRNMEAVVSSLFGLLPYILISDFCALYKFCLYLLTVACPVPMPDIE